MPMSETHDADYADDGGDASVKYHQQLHDQLAAFFNIWEGAAPTDYAPASTVSATTANVDAAGAVMNADITTAAMAFVIDEDDMVSDSATKVPTQQSVRAYVAANAASPPEVEVFTASGTWTKPAGAVLVEVIAFGSGGSGASATSGGGGGGGACATKLLLASQLAATETVTVPAGGAGVSGAGTPGNDGAAAKFGNHVTAGGGGAGISNAGGGGGGAAGMNAVNTTAGNEIKASTTSLTRSPGYAGGAPNISAESGGGGGGTNASPGGRSLHGGGGGGSGGGTPSNGGANGYSTDGLWSGGGGGANGNPGAAGTSRSGTGRGGDGGGGGASGGVGGAGGIPGGGGGGAASGVLTGSGARGEVIVITYF